MCATVTLTRIWFSVLGEPKVSHIIMVYGFLNTKPVNSLVIYAVTAV